MPLISYKVRQGTDVLIPSGNADLHSCEGRSCREMWCFRQFQFSMGSVSFERFGLHLYLYCSLKKGGGLQYEREFNKSCMGRRGSCPCMKSCMKTRGRNKVNNSKVCPLITSIIQRCGGMWPKCR